MKKLLNIIIVFVLVGVQQFSIADDKAYEQTLDIVQIKPNLYQHISYSTYKGHQIPSNGLIYVIANEAVIIDTPWSEAATLKLLDWLKSQGLTAKLSISTHSHSDTAAGIPVLNKLNIPTYALNKTNELLAADNKAQASHSFTGPSLDLIEDKLELHYVGGGHTIDNIVVWLPEEKTLFGGCMVKSLGSKHLGYIDEADMAAWPNSLNKLNTQFSSAEIVVPGHGKYGDMALVEHSIALLNHHTNKH